jgi:hypothetical protein
MIVVTPPLEIAEARKVTQLLLMRCVLDGGGVMFLSDRVLLLWVGASCRSAQNRRRSGRPIQSFR